MFMKVFTTEAKAVTYAREQGGKVVVRYEWDDMRHALVKTYIVKF